MSIDSRLKKIFSRLKEKDPAEAYDWWATAYDNQPGNLMLAMDEMIFTGLLNEIDINDITIADIGCGTGRHWQKIFDRHPAQLIGYDVSEGMLGQLRKKFPVAVTYPIHTHLLPELADQSCDMVISTLAISKSRLIKSSIVFGL